MPALPAAQLFSSFTGSIPFGYHPPCWMPTHYFDCTLYISHCIFLYIVGKLIHTYFCKCYTPSAWNILSFFSNLILMCLYLSAKVYPILEPWYFFFFFGHANQLTSQMRIEPGPLIFQESMESVPLGCQGNSQPWYSLDRATVDSHIALGLNLSTVLDHRLTHRLLLLWDRP